MKFYKIALAVVTIATLTPVVSNASPEKASLKACARAFASTMAAAGAAAPAFKLAYYGSSGSVLADFYPTAYTFSLEAHDPKSGAAVARALCSTDARGTVTALSSIPLETKAATLASGY
jgi:hypothetical protein